MAGVDRYRRAHTRTQRRIVSAMIKRDTHRNALNHLDPVTGRVLRGQQREFRTRRLAEALHAAVPVVIRIRIDAHLDALVGAQVGQIRFFEVGLDPHVAVGDEAHHGVAAFDVGADFRFFARYF